MDSLAPDDLNKHFKFSLSSTGVYDSNANHYSSSFSSSSVCSTTTNNLSFSLHQRLHPQFSSSSFSGKRISDILRYFMLALFRIGFYVFVILSLSDCWFQVGSTAAAAVLVIGEDRPTQDYDPLNSSSLPVVQLPIPQALVLDANSEKLRIRSNDTSVNDGNSGPLTATSYSHSGISNNNNNNSIITMFTTATTATKATAAATLSALHSNGIINTITSTLSSLSSNGTEWSTLGGGTSSPTLSSSPSSSTMSPLGEFTMPAVHTVLVSIVLLFVILGTIVGNVLVCIAVCMVRKLRRPCNYLLVSLALSDLCVAVLVMPMALLYEVLEKWNFGTLLCDVWVSFDVLCCTASILNLCAISVDRYLAITKPLEYGVKRTPRRMMLCVALVWLAAACISLPPLLILGNEHVDENGKPMCSVCQNFAYQIYATLGSFYIPLAVMLFVYYQIFRAARRIVLEEKRAQTHLQHALNGTGSPPGHTELDGNGQPHRHSSYGNTSLNYSTCGGLSTSHNSGAGHGGGSGSSGLLGSPHQKKLRFQLAKEKKASTTLGIIMSAFTICWLPFFILALIRPFVESETTHVPQSLSSLFLWLGYANSLLNPIIYATLNRDFRKPFQEILYFRCSSLNTMMRENYYQDQYGEPPSQRVMLGDERHGARESFL